MKFAKPAFELSIGREYYWVFIKHHIFITSLAVLGELRVQRGDRGLNNPLNTVRGVQGRTKEAAKTLPEGCGGEERGF